MPELPEVQVLAEALDARLPGRVVTGVRLVSFTVAKTADPPLDALAGHAFGRFGRRGKWLLLGIDDGSSLCVHLMHGGRLGLWPEPAKGRPKTLLAALGLDDGTELRLIEYGTKKRAGLWWVPEPERVANIAGLGPDALDPTLDAPTLVARLAEPSAQLHPALRDQRRIAGIGRAYADEICHRARLSPFAATRSLDAAAGVALLGAIRAVLGEGIVHERAALAAVKGTGARMPDKHDRSWMAVHDRTGADCAQCGTPGAVRAVHFADHVIGYCPVCQTGGRLLKDRRLSRLGIVEE